MSMKADSRNLEPEIGPTVSFWFWWTSFSVFIYMLLCSARGHVIFLGGQAMSVILPHTELLNPQPRLSFRSQDFHKGAGPKRWPVQMPKIISGFINTSAFSRIVSKLKLLYWAFVWDRKHTVLTHVLVHCALILFCMLCCSRVNAVLESVWKSMCFGSPLLRPWKICVKLGNCTEKSLKIGIVVL